MRFVVSSIGSSTVYEINLHVPLQWNRNTLFGLIDSIILELLNLLLL